MVGCLRLQWHGDLGGAGGQGGGPWTARCFWAEGRRDRLTFDAAGVLRLRPSFGIRHAGLVYVNGEYLPEDRSQGFRFFVAVF